MKKISLDKLKLGMFLAEDVFNESGQVITTKDTEVTLEIIEKLENFGINFVAVMEQQEVEVLSLKLQQEAELKKILEEISPEIAEAENNISADVEDTSTSNGERLLTESIFEKKNQESYIKFKENIDKETAIISNGFANLLKCNPKHNNLGAFDVIAKAVYESNKSSLNLLDMIYSMHEISDVVYSHCLNVAMIAGQLGRWLGMSDNDIQLLINCGLFHDIGKLLIPEEVLNKPSKLTPEEYEIIKTHVTKGFEFLNKFNNIDVKIKRAVLLHHERCDGSGYPMQLTGDQLDDFTKIIAIADTYEAMTSSRSYRNSICPFKVAEEFEKDGLHKFDTKFILLFLDKMLQTYLQRKVRLSDGRTGTVALINRTIKSKPLIQLDDGSFIDLAKQQDLTIEELIN